MDDDKIIDLFNKGLSLKQLSTEYVNYKKLRNEIDKMVRKVSLKEAEKIVLKVVYNYHMEQLKLNNDIN